MSHDIKKCENKCPKCGAGINKIEWGKAKYSAEDYTIPAVCTDCDCEFSEHYIYSYTTIDNEREEQND